MVYSIHYAPEATWCDCFPNVPPDVYKKRVVPIFNDSYRWYMA